MKKVIIVLILAIVITSMRMTLFAAEYSCSVEAGRVYTGYNDVRIPGDDGTLFSLSDDLDARTGSSVRFEPSIIIGKHVLGLLVAPLRIKSEGQFDKDVLFEDAVFLANVDTSAVFRFDSYRISWGYYLFEQDLFRIALGVTGKIRDAEIRLKQGDLEASKKNTGFVPLVHFDAEMILSSRISLRLRGDALAAPQGRAEDILSALYFVPVEHVRVYAGYRFLEGGADNSEVYTFSMFHYAVAGLEVKI